MTSLQVQVIVPTGLLYEGECLQVVGEAENGSFCMLPQHVDFLTSLKQGLLTLTNSRKEEVFFAVDQGILVKKNRHVFISTPNAVQGELGELEDALREQREAVDSEENQSRSSLDRLEANLVRQILEWEGGGRV